MEGLPGEISILKDIIARHSRFNIMSYILKDCFM